MLAHLAHLHDPNDGGLDQDLAVLLDVFVGGLLVHLDEESIFYFIKRTSFFFWRKVSVFTILLCKIVYKNKNLVLWVTSWYHLFFLICFEKM